MDPKQPGYENLTVYNTHQTLLGLPFYCAGAKQPAIPYERARWHEEIEIKYMLSGKAEITCGPRVFMAEKGDLVVINSCELHSIRPCDGEQPVYHLLMLSPETLYSANFAPLLAPLADGGFRIRNRISGDPVVADWMCRLFASMQAQETGYELRAVGYFSLLLAHLMQNYPQSGPAQTVSNDVRKYMEKLRPAIVYIQEHYREELKTQDLARHCGLSLYHFCRLFKQVTGYTPVTYLNQLRLHKARILLETSLLTVAEVGAAVGYEDPAYFSRSFKKYMGYSPVNYRNTAK